MSTPMTEADQADSALTPELVNLQESAVKELEGLQKLQGTDKKDKNADIKSMISYYNDLTRTTEDRRERIAQSSTQSLGLTITALGIVAALSMTAVIKAFIVAVLLVILLFTILKLYEFQVQSGFRYPFLRLTALGNKWKWFYYGNQHILEINNNPFKASATVLADQISYVRGLNFFLQKYRTEDIDREITDNVIQLYLLQVHNFYKNQFYLRLLHYDQLAARFVVWALVVYWIVVILLGIFVPAWRPALFKSI